MQKPKDSDTKNLMDDFTAEKSAQKPVEKEEIDENYYPFWQQELYINLLVEHQKYPKGNSAVVPPEIAKALKIDFEKNSYEPIIYLSDFWNLKKNMFQLNDTLSGTNLNLTLNFQMFWPMYFQM